MLKDIGFITENCNYYSGGRYYAWMVAKALKEAGANLEVYTNVLPNFKYDFEKFYNSLLITRKKSVLQVSEYHEVYIGTPVYGNINATSLAQHYRKECFCFIYDPLPMIKIFVPHDYAMEYKYFVPMEVHLRQDFVKIITLTNYSKPFIADWLGKRAEDIITLYPRVNSRVIESVADEKQEDWIVWISRIVERKNYRHTLEAFSKTPKKWKLHLFTSTEDGDLSALTYFFEMYHIQDRVFMHSCLNDYDKFYFFKKGKIMLNSSLFEGFGMYIIEGRALGMRCVQYDYPIFREIYNDDGMYYAERENVDDLASQLNKAIKDTEKHGMLEKKTDFYFEHMVDDVKKIFKNYL